MNVDLLSAELIRDEAMALRLYADSVGKHTIGVGRNLDDVGISEGEALFMLHNDIDRTMRDLDQHLPFWRSLDEVRQRVLANMAFNMGIGNDERGLLSFKRTLILIEAGQFTEAAKSMADSRWATQVGDRAKRLVWMMTTGKDYPLLRRSTDPPIAPPTETA